MDPGISQDTSGQASQPQASTSGRSSAVPELDPAQWQASFQQCLELLKGPADEKRWVTFSHCYQSFTSSELFDCDAAWSIVRARK